MGAVQLGRVYKVRTAQLEHRPEVVGQGLQQRLEAVGGN